jgi:SAM-dependent methyltransferase
MSSPNLRCPCHEKRELVENNGDFACSGENCPHRQEPYLFKMRHGRPVLISFEKTETLCSPATNDASERQFAGNPSRFMDAARRLVYGRSNLSRQNCARFVDLLKQSSTSPTVLVIGAGAKGEGSDRLWSDPALHKTGIDIYVSPTVDYVADAHFLPFADASFDGAWIQAVLEHVVSPEDVTREIHRVLKPGGVVYAETAFMQQVHGGPYNFCRFTVTGHSFLFRDFAAIDMGGNGGPSLPVGHTLGDDGNHSIPDFSRLEWGAFQQSGASNVAVESAFGVMLYQLGICAAAVLGFYLWIARVVWRFYRKTGAAAFAFATSAIAICLVNGLFQEDAYFVPLSLPFVMGLVGLTLGAADRATGSIRARITPSSMSPLSSRRPKEVM